MLFRSNPSLLEALASTQLNLLLDVGFNREVAQGAALYWTKGEGSLARLIERAERLSIDELRRFDQKTSMIIHDIYSWCSIVASYEIFFLGGTSV